MKSTIRYWVIGLLSISAWPIAAQNFSILVGTGQAISIDRPHSGSTNSTIDYLLSWRLGASKNFILARNLSFRGSASLTRKGYRSNPDQGFKSIVNYNYIDIGSLLAYRIAKDFEISSGLEVAYLTWARAWSGRGKRNPADDIHLQRVDLGIIAGLGVHLTERLFIGGKVVYGLLPVINWGGTEAPTDAGIIKTNFRTFNRTYLMTANFLLGTP